MQTGDAREKVFGFMVVGISKCEVLSNMYGTWSINQSVLRLRTGMTGISVNVCELLNREYPMNE